MRKTPDLYEKDDVPDYQYCPGRYAVPVFPGFIGKECEVIGVFLVYCAKSFFETRESEKVRMEEMKMETGSEEPESEEMEEIEL